MNNCSHKYTGVPEGSSGSSYSPSLWKTPSPHNGDNSLCMQRTHIAYIHIHVYVCLCVYVRTWAQQSDTALGGMHVCHLAFLHITAMYYTLKFMLCQGANRLNLNPKSNVTIYGVELYIF